MKTILIVFLLGASTLLNYAANPTGINAKKASRVVDCALEGYILLASSQTGDGTIVKVRVYNSFNQLILEQDCGSYSCSVNVSGLKAGNYTAKVYTTNAPVYTEFFSIP